MKVLIPAYEPKEGEEIGLFGTVVRRLPAIAAIEVQLYGKSPTDTVILQVKDCWITTSQAIPD